MLHGDDMALIFSESVQGARQGDPQRAHEQKLKPPEREVHSLINEDGNKRLAETHIEWSAREEGERR